jgi:hypothetical protein
MNDATRIALLDDLPSMTVTFYRGPTCTRAPSALQSTSSNNLYRPDVHLLPSEARDALVISACILTLKS